MLPSKKAIDAMHIEELNETMNKLGGRGFSPSMSLASKRRMLQRIVTSRAMLEVTTMPNHVKLNRPPKAIPKAVLNEDVLTRTLFYAARTARISLEDAANVAQALLLGLGEFDEDYRKLAANTFVHLNQQYGWGIRQFNDGTVEVYS